MRPDSIHVGLGGESLPRSRMPFPSCAALLGDLGQILLHGLQVKVKPENPADVITSFCCLSCATRLGLVLWAWSLVP